MKMFGKVIIVAVICAALIGVSAWWVAQRGPASLWQGENAVERYIKIVADGPVLHYQETLFWNENQFSRIMEKSGFQSAQIEQFKEKYSVAADNFSVEFGEENKTTT